MHATLSHLQSAIRTALQKGHVCRIYQDSLLACWPRLSEEVRTEKILQFAAQNHRSVNLRAVGNLGIIAEFEKLTQEADL
jgi:hypothetical protein